MTAPHYESFIMDSARWEDFSFRDGDVVISTPAKSGTTWLSMCCLVLIHGQPTLPAPMSKLVPWLDQVLAPIDEITARLDAQQHRRVIKTHTPLDAVPWDERVTYVGIGRDPRDTLLSFANHLQNMDVEVVLERRAAAGLASAPPVLARPTDPVDLFLHAVDDVSPATACTSSVLFILHNLRALWDRRHEPNVALFHYGDLRADLDSEMRRLATILDVKVDEARWPELVHAATLDSMREHADDVAPNADVKLWHDNKRFFAEGRAGAWRTALPEGALRRYDERVEELAGDDPAFVDWVHHGWALRG